MSAYSSSTDMRFLVLQTRLDTIIVEGAINIFQADLCNYDALNNIVYTLKPNYIIHLAAITHVAHRNVRETYETNLIGSYNLLKAASNIKRLHRFNNTYELGKCIWQL